MTGFDDLLSSVREDRKQFRVYAHGDTPAVADALASHNVDVDRHSLPSAVPGAFLVVRDEDGFAGAIPFDELDSLLEPPVERPPALADASKGYRVLFDALEGAVFAALGRDDLLAVSREIEDRVFREGSGTLRVTVQSFERFRPQVDRYRRLGAETDVDVHVYGTGDWDPPALDGVRYHELAGVGYDRYWVLAYVDNRGGCANALVAEETPDGYEGFWTDDLDRARRAMDVLERA